MTDAVIRVEGIGKRYRIGERARQGALLRDVLAGAFRRNGKRSSQETIWAVRDVSFEVKQGEVVGLIGRNGAGKSTLLKLLARITRPTVGHAELHGRIASLLEVGTGFHPELTGRENIFLSGAILGMSKAEIVRKFDEIVAFSEVERFIDTPLKHYSSGMGMRLAFAVAAHLEPEILLVDEVLSVGDASFQKKCLGKMQEVSRGGRTILFVSHQMNAIRRLCERVFWLDGGRVRAAGETREVAASYELASTDLAKKRNDPAACFLDWDIPGSQNTLHDGMREVTLRFSMRLNKAVSRGHLGVNIFAEGEVLVGGWGFDDVDIPEGLQDVNVKLPFLPLRPGVYSIRCSLFNRGTNLNGGQLVESWEATRSLVVDSDPLSHPQDRWSGLLNVPGRLCISPADARTAEAEHQRAPELR